MFLGVGTFYEDEDISEDADQANFRGNIYLSFRENLNSNLEAVLVAYYQPSYKTIADYRLRGNAGLETKILESLALVNSVEYAYDSRPPQNIQREDFSYKVTLNFNY